HDVGAGDAVRPVLGHGSRAGHRRLAGKKENRAGQRRHDADAHAALRRLADFGRHHRRGLDVHSRFGAGADRRTTYDDGPVTIALLTGIASMSASPKDIPMFDAAIFRRAIIESFRKLSPRVQVRNPVMFTVFVGGIVTL